jgi:hypothetical protein
MNKLLNEQKERYKLEIKNNKDAYIVIEKEKRNKWEKSRI